MENGTPTVGSYLREWRQRRRMSQLDLSVEANISSKHLSFVETGRSRPSRDMIQHLAEHLEIPFRSRNEIFLAAGFAPAFKERPLDDPEMKSALAAVNLVLTGHEPFPALAVDRHWNMVLANRCVTPLTTGVDAKLLVPPVNVLRATLHPDGLAPRILNLRQLRNNLLASLRRQVEMSADPVLAELYEELESYPAPASKLPPSENDFAGVVVPMKVATEVGTLSLFTTLTVFGTPVDVTLSELAVEAFFPADPQTAEILREFSDNPAN